LDLYTNIDRSFNSRRYRRHVDEKWRNIQFQKLTDSLIEAGDLSIWGQFFDKFTHIVSALVKIKLQYNKEIQWEFRFPYYDMGDPNGIDGFDLTGWRLFYGLKLPNAADYTPVAASDNFSAIDLAIDTVAACVSYLRN
jgi:hypothetical protein